MAITNKSWYQDVVKVSPIVMEASTPDDKKYIEKMGKDDVHQINGTLVQGLYKTILDRKDCDFGDIPSSKGDIEKCKYYNSTRESLDIIATLMQKNEIPTTDVDVVNESISNIRRLKPTFELGFDLKQDYLILFYNTIVMAVIDSTSMIIAEYMNYLVGPEQTRYDSVKSRNDKSRGRISLDSLQRFNNEVRVGHFDSMANYILDAQRKNFVGTIVIAGVAIAALSAVVPVTRELIYFFYKSRVRLSDYMNMQADFLELNKLGVEASTASASKKKEILKKQEKIILKLRRNADKLKINDEDIGVLSKKQVENDNKQFSLKNIEKQMYSNKMNGAGFNIV